MFTYSRCRNQANEKEYNNQNMKFHFKTTKAKPLQVSTFENNNDIAWKSQYPSHRAYSRGNRAHWCDFRLNGHKIAARAKFWQKGIKTKVASSC